MCYCVYILFSTISLKTCSSKLARKTFEFRNLFPSREKKNVYFDSLQTAAIEILNISCCAKSPPTTRIVCMKNNDDGATEMRLVVRRTLLSERKSWISRSTRRDSNSCLPVFLFVLVTGMSFHYYHLGVIELAALQKTWKWGGQRINAACFPPGCLQRAALNFIRTDCKHIHNHTDEYSLWLLNDISIYPVCLRYRWPRTKQFNASVGSL